MRQALYLLGIIYDRGRPGFDVLKKFFVPVPGISTLCKIRQHYPRLFDSWTLTGSNRGAARLVETLHGLLLRCLEVDASRCNGVRRGDLGGGFDGQLGTILTSVRRVQEECAPTDREGAQQVSAVFLVKRDGIHGIEIINEPRFQQCSDLARRRERKVVVGDRECDTREGVG